MHVKPIASGEVLLNSPAAPLAEQLDRGGLRELLRRHYNDAAAIEMESAGAIKAAQLNDDLPFLAIRGISDRADGTKRGDADQELQPMAAAHAAAFAAACLRKLAEAEAAREQGRPTAAGPGAPPGATQFVIGHGAPVFAVQNGNIYTHPPAAEPPPSGRLRRILGDLLFSTRIDHPAGQLVGRLRARRYPRGRREERGSAPLVAPGSPDRADRDAAGRGAAQRDQRGRQFRDARDGHSQGQEAHPRSFRPGWAYRRRAPAGP